MNVRWALDADEILLYCAVVVIGALFAYFVHGLGLMTVFVDQNAHLNIARQVTDSLTPGVSQIGFWPPLLHVLMAPVASVDTLFATGVAGAVTLIPLLAIGCVLLYRIIGCFTTARWIRIWGSAFFVLSPYVLYYAVTPMTEALFMVSLLAVAYALLVWMQERSIPSLAILGIAVALAGLARFEGLVLVPIVAIAIITTLFFNRSSYHHIEGTVYLYAVPALMGVGFVFVYGLAYAGDPLAFMRGAWSAIAQQQTYVLPTAGDTLASIAYMLKASAYMFGTSEVAIGLVSFSLAFVYAWRLRLHDRFLAACAVLASPFLIDVSALVDGTAVMYVNDFPPFGEFFNERYGLYWFGFIALSTAIALAALAGGERERRPRAARTAMVIAALFMTVHVGFLYRTAFAETFTVIGNSSEGFLAHDQRELASSLTRNYDGGQILITRGVQNFATVHAGIPLARYIMESNYRYYDRALEAPWLFARFVVMYNPNVELDAWRKKSELVSVRWGDSGDFESAYELIFENRTERLYRLRDADVRAAAAELGVSTSFIPSLAREAHAYDPEIIAGAHGGTLGKLLLTSVISRAETSTEALSRLHEIK